MNELNRDALRQRVEEVVRQDKRNSRISFFAVSVVMFFIFMAISWRMYQSTPIIQQSLGDPLATLLLIMLSAGWATTLFFQGMALLMDSAAMDRQFRDRATARALREEVFDGATENVKNQPRQPHEPIMLTDDGELRSADSAQYTTSGKKSTR